MKDTVNFCYMQTQSDLLHLFLFLIWPSCADLVPYFMIQGPLSYNQTKTCMHLETTRPQEEEEEMKVEKETATLTSFKDDRCMQMGGYNEQGSTESRPIKEPPPHFDMVKNGMAGTHARTHTHTHTHTHIKQRVFRFLIHMYRKI